jgi:hypothetical protein
VAFTFRKQKNRESKKSKLCFLSMHRSGAAMAWNVFKFCTALRGLGSIMILLVLGVVGVTYYAVVLTTYGPALYDGGLDSLIALIVLILFHFLVSHEQSWNFSFFFVVGFLKFCAFWFSKYLNHIQKFSLFYIMLKFIIFFLQLFFFLIENLLFNIFAN